MVSRVDKFVMGWEASIMWPLVQGAGCELRFTVLKAVAEAQGKGRRPVVHFP